MLKKGGYVLGRCRGSVDPDAFMARYGEKGSFRELHWLVERSGEQAAMVPASAHWGTTPASRCSSFHLIRSKERHRLTFKYFDSTGKYDNNGGPRIARASWIPWKCKGNCHVEFTAMKSGGRMCMHPLAQLSMHKPMFSFCRPISISRTINPQRHGRILLLCHFLLLQDIEGACG